MVATDAPLREVRLALVLNGGVSLAVWIGGVTREIDAARRGVDDGEHDTAAVYGAINAALRQTAVVDVIGGASAGGINGVLLAAAIYNGVPLGDLRETWISIGDFRKLLRSQSESDPPSLMHGDGVVLPQLATELGRLWRPIPRPANPRLYLYVTATDLFGYARHFEDTGGREFQETDHRRVFRFEHDDQSDDADDDDDGPDGVLRNLVPFGSQDARSLLAHAARASASFPVAFEPHLHRVRDPDGGSPQHALIDGGILDNQPFNPVLDRVSVLRADRPTKRVVVYVVPYVTEVGTAIETRDATARDTVVAASTLPRDLPKLEGLDRVSQEVRRQRHAMAERAEALRTIRVPTRRRLARSLLPAYRRTRFDGSLRVFAAWADPRFRPGNGTIAQDPSQEPEDVLPLVAPPPEAPGHVPWIPDQRRVGWSAEEEGPWRWGLSPAERIAAWALIALRFDEEQGRDAGTRGVALPGRVLASQLIDDARAAKVRLRRAFVAQRRRTAEPPPVSGPAELVDRAMGAYAAIEGDLRRLQAAFAELDALLSATVTGGVEGLLHLEVVRNATAIHEESVSFPFHFLLASAGVENSLGHPAGTPEEKLAGMKLGHFGGFLKQSWRANDWLWGRMDGVEHVVRALVDADRLGELPDVGCASRQLARVAFGRQPAAAPGTTSELAARWRSDLETSGLTVSEPAAYHSFRRVVEMAAAPSSPAEGETALALLRRALARPAQLRVLRADLSRAAETARDDMADGASRTTAGAFWSTAFPADPAAVTNGQLVRLFQTMHIGSESIRREAGSRLVLDVGAQTVSVAAALFAGRRGGLPAVVRGILASVRAVTLTVSRLVQLVARKPWFGAAVFALLVVLVVGAGLSHSTVGGAVFPGLALAAIVVGLALFTIATGTLEAPPGTPWRRGVVGFFAAGAPAAYAVVALLLRGRVLAPSWPHWLDAHLGSGAAVGVGIAATAATALALAVAATAPSPDGTWRRRALTAYRAVVLLALAAAGAGVAFERWQHPADGGSGWPTLADARRAIPLILLVLAVLPLADALVSAVAQVRRRHAAPPP